MSKTFLFFTVGCTLILTACQNFSSQSTTSDMQLLQQVNNLQATPSSEGNSARLLKGRSHCLIEFTGFYETGKATEQWTFKGNHLLSAHTTIYHYAHDALVNSDHPAKAPMVASEQKRNFNIQNGNIQNNFKALLGHFNTTQLQQCL